MAGLINWNFLQKMAFQNAGPQPMQNAEHMWSSHAAMYNFMSGLEEKYSQKQVDEMILDPDDTVLDIGCGIGRLAVPVAKRAKAVTALDIADGMLAQCRHNAAAARLDNISFRKMDWCDAAVGSNIEQHDIAYASRSVGHSDILKLNAVAAKYAFLLSFSQYPSLRDVCLDLLKGLKEDEPGNGRRAPAGKDWRTLGYNVPFNILYDLGIDPTVKVIDDGFERIYPNRETAYGDLRFLTREIVPDGILTADQEAIFRKNVDRYLTRQENGAWRFFRGTKTFVIGWETKVLS